MTRAVVVINPLSGRGRYDNQIQQHAALARDVLRNHHIEALVRPTTAAGDAREFARQAAADGYDLVIAWGGDGTINEAACALAHTEVPLGIIPAGSGNGLAWDLGIPFDARAALELAVTGRTLNIDAGQVNDCLFFNIAGIGIDAVIATRFAERGLRQRGPMAYAQLSLNELIGYHAQTYALTIDGQTVSHQALLIALANGRQYGNRVLIAPGAKLDDGLLEVVVVEHLSMLDIAWRLPSLFRGTLQPRRGITMRAAANLTITADGPIAFHVDGEPRVDDRELTVTTHPGALRVRAPAL